MSGSWWRVNTTFGAVIVMPTASFYDSHFAISTTLSFSFILFFEAMLLRIEDPVHLKTFTCTESGVAELKKYYEAKKRKEAGATKMSKVVPM